MNASFAKNLVELLNDKIKECDELRAAIAKAEASKTEASEKK